MSRPRTHRITPRRGGFALVAALVLLVVLATVGAAMMRLTGVEQDGSSQAILGSRAGWAARSGVEWALHRARTTGSCPSATLDLDEAALSGFRVVVSCSSSIHSEGGQERTSLAIRSQASFGAPGEAHFVFRELSVSIVL